MTELRTRTVGEIESPSLAPDPPIDRAHLFRMTLGDHELEGEVLRLFERQSSMLLARMRGVPPDSVRALAHTLNGSARGIGAWHVARAARAVERAAGDNGDLDAPIDGLRRAIDEAALAIADILLGPRTATP